MENEISKRPNTFEIGLVLRVRRSEFPIQIDALNFDLVNGIFVFYDADGKKVCAIPSGGVYVNQL